MRSLVLAIVIMSVSASRPARAAHWDWDHLAGGVPYHDVVLGVGIGFPQLPRVSFEYGFTPRFGLGVAAAFDYAGLTYHPWWSFAPAGSLSVPMRIEVYRKNRWSAGIHLEAGMGVARLNNSTTLSMLLKLGVGVGYWIRPKLMIGGGIETPASLYVLPAFWASVPILLGPILEFHANHVFGLSVDLKAGPNVGIATPSGFILRGPIWLPGPGPGPVIGFGIAPVFKLMFSLLFHF